MKRIDLSSFVSVALSLMVPVAAVAQGAQTTAYEQWYEALREIQPDPSRGAPVSQLEFRHDAATFVLASGQMNLLVAVDGRTVGAVWVGEGRFRMDAPIPVEQAQLERYYDTPSLDEEIRRAVFFFTDDPSTMFLDVAWQQSPPHRDARREVEEAMKYVSDDDGWMARDFALPMLNNVPGFLHAHVAEDRGDPLIFRRNPFAAEEISLSQRTARTQWREVISQFHQESDYASGRSASAEALDAIRIPFVDFNGTVQRNLDFSASVTMDVVRTRPEVRWIPFSLFSELEVDSISWADGSPVTHYRPEDRSDLWIDLEGAPADSTQITFHYQGELLEQPRRGLWTIVRSTTTWFPRYQFWRPATYRLTFNHHEDFKVASVGYLQSESAPVDDMVTTVWETPVVRQATFNIGRFDEHESNDPRAPNLKIQIDEDAHRELGNLASDANMFLLRQRDMADQVMRDLIGAFAFYNEVYGQTTVDRFTASEIFSNHGEAYAGLVLLAWSTFQWTSDEGFDEMFRAHEVAHQWWGIGIHPATYHDRWMSEGFAEFSGLWYTARVRASHELFQRRLKETREAIWDRKDEAGPIWLGTRVGDSRNPEDYALTIYEKGAWVLHMLRVLMTDPNTGSDAAFESMIKDFYNRYFGIPVTTEQFKAVVEEHAGIDMTWFFDQFVYGTSLPKYTWSYNLEALPTGEYKATLRVRQEEVPDSFRMVVPVYLDFGAAGNAQVNIEVSGPETVVELPLLPMEPTEIVFNPFESVLAETDQEGWRN